MRVSLVIPALCAGLVVPSLAFAQPSAADRDTARTLMNDGDKAFAARDFTSAVKAYQTAHGIMHVPSTGTSYALAAVELGLFLEAREACVEVTKMPATSGEPTAFVKARSDCAALLPKAEAKIATLRMKIEPAGGAARIEIDGNAIPTGALGVARKINPGKHMLKGTLAGHADLEKTFEAADGATVELALTFERAAAGAQGPAASAAGAGAATTDLPAGRSSLVYVGFGVAAVGLATGAVTGVVSLGKAGDAEKGCIANHCPPANQGAADDARLFGNISTVGFGVGVLGLGVGIYGLVAGGKSATALSPTAPPPRIAPIMGLGNLGVRGSF